MEYNGLAKHAQGKVFVDQLFGSAAAAKEAIKKHGKENVVNGTIGVLCDEEGKFVFLPTVEKVFRNLESENIAAYASVRGTDEYLSAVEGLTFGESRPDAYIESVATSGGAGVVCNVIWNYSNTGDAVLTHDWYWQPYQVLCSDVQRHLETFSFYNDEYKFNIQDFADKVQGLLEKQENLVVILNSPNNNPTGYSLTDEEWDMVLDVFKEQAANGKTLVLLVDIAYIEFMEDPEKGRKFMKKFGGLPENILVTLAFSASKTFTLYGQRTGAVIGVSSSKRVIDEFVNATKITGRTRWSTISNAGMSLVPAIYHNEELNQQVSEERRIYVDLVVKRAGVFVEEAKAVGLEILPYCGGFFVSVPAENADAASMYLREKYSVYIAALEKGIRIAVCSLPVAQVEGLAAKVKEAIDAVN